MRPYEKAGRLIRLVSWISLIVIVGIVLAVTLGSGTVDSGLLVFAVFGIAFSIFQLYLGKAIKDHRNWARTVGIVFGILWLFGFPIGTILGAYVLWCLTGGWAAQTA